MRVRARAGGLQVASQCRCTARAQIHLFLKTMPSLLHVFSMLYKNDRVWKDCTVMGSNSSTVTYTSLEEELKLLYM